MNADDKREAETLRNKITHLIDRGTNPERTPEERLEAIQQAAEYLIRLHAIAGRTRADRCG